MLNRKQTRIHEKQKHKYAIVYEEKISQQLPSVVCVRYTYHMRWRTERKRFPVLIPSLAHIT